MVNLQTIINKIADYLDLSSLDLSSLSSYLRSFLEGVLSSVTTAASQVMVVTSSILSMFVTLVLAIVFSIYMLAGREKLLDQGRRLLRAYLPAKHVSWVSDVIRLTAETFTNFVSGQAIEAAFWAVCAPGYLLHPGRLCCLIGVIVGVSALIPVAGVYRGYPVRLPAGYGVPGAGAHLPDLSVHSPADRGQCDLPPGGGYLHWPAGHLVLTAVTVGGGLFGLLGRAAQCAGGFCDVCPAEAGCDAAAAGKATRRAGNQRRITTKRRAEVSFGAPFFYVVIRTGR